MIVVYFKLTSGRKRTLCIKVICNNIIDTPVAIREI